MLRFQQEFLRRVVDLDEASSRYFNLMALVAFLRILWVICQTSGVFGTPPDTWIEDGEKILAWLLWIALAIGTVFHILAIMERRQSETNEPISGLVTNMAGGAFFVLLASRISSVVIDTTPNFFTWASLLRDGVTLGAVYALIALGYTLVYGILFMINFAHGEVMMFGAYGGWFATMYVLNNRTRTFEEGSAVIAEIAVPLLVAILFLPLEDLISRRQNRQAATTTDPRWIFTLTSIPIRILLGAVIGYGALRGLGQNAPHVYLLVITVIGLLFVTVVGMLTSIFVAVTLERIAYRPFRKAPRLTPLITAIGASIFLQQTALRIFGPSAQSYASGRPKLLFDPLTFDVSFGQLGTVPISKLGLVIIFVSLSLMAFLFFIVRRTKLGRGMRAVAEDKDTAALMGTNVDRVIVMTFVLGAALAGAAGVMLGFRDNQVSFRFGFVYGLKAFTAAVLGGIGNIPGAMLGGFFLGLVEAIGPTALGFDNAWKDVIAFSLLTLVIIFRPTGLLGETAAEKKV